MNSTNFFLEICKQNCQRQKECAVGEETGGGAGEGGRLCVARGRRPGTGRSPSREEARGYAQGKCASRGGTRRRKRRSSQRSAQRGRRRAATDEEGEACSSDLYEAKILLVI
ncbi:hypothetical protein HN51_043103 [Arachis hypogaea]